MSVARLLTAAALAAALLAGCTAGTSAERASGGYVQGDYGITVVPESERPDAPPVAGESLDGEQVSLDDYAGQTVLLNVWFAQCSPCREEAPDLVTAERELRGDEVQFLGINIRDDPDGAAQFVETFGITWPSIADPTSSQLLGFRGDLPAVAVPTTYVIDADGRVAARLLGPQSAQTLVDVVDEVGTGG